MRAITQRTIDSLKETVSLMRDCKESQIETESDREYPNEERLDNMEEQLNILEEVLSLLEDYEV